MAEAVRSAFDSSKGNLTLSNVPLSNSSLNDPLIVNELRAMGGALRRLDLSNCGLTALPRDLSFLKVLEVIILVVFILCSSNDMS